jgi:hypothetical protein
MMRGCFFITAVIMAALAALPSSAHAAEHITLRNGFDYFCDHHAEVNGQIRLYLSAGEDNYIDLRPEEIAEIEELPDPPPEPKSDTSATSIPSAASVSTRQDAKLSPGDLHEMLTRAGNEHNVDVDLLASLVKAESGGNTRAVSRAGARGLTQLMPATAKDMGVADSFKPDDNLRGGAKYLDQLLILYHDNLALALAAYNAGPEAVAKYHGIPPYHETQVYVARVIHEFNRRVLAREAEAKRAAEQARRSKASEASSQEKPDH